LFVLNRTLKPRHICRSALARLRALRAAYQGLRPFDAGPTSSACPRS